MNDAERILAGRAHHDGRLDVTWAFNRTPGNWAIRTLAYGLRKTLRKCTSAVTFDLPSFRRAIEAAPRDALFVLAPSHRSYFDFLLGSYPTVTDVYAALAERNILIESPQGQYSWGPAAHEIHELRMQASTLPRAALRLGPQCSHAHP